MNPKGGSSSQAKGEGSAQWFPVCLKMLKAVISSCSGLSRLSSICPQTFTEWRRAEKRRRGNEAFTFARFGEAGEVCFHKVRAAKPLLGKSHTGRREVRRQHVFTREAAHKTSSLNNLLIKCYKCDHFLLSHSFQKNLPMPDNLKHTHTHEERKVIVWRRVCTDS